MILLALVPFLQAEESAVPAMAVDGQVYRPPIDGGVLLWADESIVREGAGAKAVVGWVHEPLVWVWEDTGERVPLVDDAVGINVIGSFGWWRLRGGVDVPLYLYAAGEAGSGPGLGALGLDAKGMILDREDAPLGLALDLRFDVPTGSAVVPLASDGLGWEATIVADKRVGPVLLAANLGTRGVPALDAESVELSNQLAARVGAGFDPGGTWGLSLDLAAYAELSDLGNAAGAPAEALFGGWYRVADVLRLSAGVGHGLGNGIGSSNGRAVLGLSWEPSAEKDKPDAVAVVAPPKAEPAKPPPAKTEPVKAEPAKTEPAKIEPTVAVAVPAVKVVPVPTAREPVVVSANRLVLYQRISFDGASLRSESGLQLDSLVRFLANHSEVETVRIEGHTDGRGDPSDELALSGTRAGIVLEYLVRKGLPRERFYAAGYGGMRPIVQGADETARITNERIDFVITKWAEEHEPQ